MPTEVQYAAAELLRRRRARSSLVDYVKAIDVPGRPVSVDEDEWLFSSIETGVAAHHLLILSIMEKVIKREIPRAMFFLPPGSAKSTYGSVVAPTWAMGKFPGTKIILTSYGSDLAKKQGRRARQIVRSKHFSSIFGAEISTDTAAADEWALSNGSEYMAGGILSGITGNRAHGLIIDDPIKGREQADSETIRQKTWEAYQDDLRTRLVPGGWEIIIQTRWHEDDLAGRILPEDYDGSSGLIDCRDGRPWYVVCLPAQCERTDDPLGRKVGDYLWPEWFIDGHFEGFKKLARTWSALFQQRPTPEMGTFFLREWFKFYNPARPPEDVNCYISTDFAVTDNDGDFTELGVLGVNPEDDIYILDWWSGQKTADIWIDALLDQIKRYQPFCCFGESGVIRRAIEPFLTRRMQERSIYGRVEWLSRTADKSTCARAIQGRAAQGKVYLPDNEIGYAILDELLKFPAGARDNKVDVLALFGMALDQAHPAMVKEAVLKPLTQAQEDFNIIRGIRTGTAINIEW